MRITAIRAKISFLAGVFTLLALLGTGTANALSYPPGHLIDDYVMSDTSTMDQGAIQGFLASKHSYLATYVSSSGRDNANISAAQIISEAASDYHINPQAIMATLQKEQSLITAQNPAQSQLDHAMGYGCPDSSGCNPKYVGLFNQIDNGTWQLRANIELSSGRNFYGYTPSSYPCNGATRYYTNALKPGNSVTFNDDYGTAYSSFTLENASTAALYCYTPHVYPGSPQEYYSGSQNFEDAFTQWGWSLYSNKCVSDDTTPIGSSITLGAINKGVKSGIVNVYSATGTKCVEAHSWRPGSGFTAWQYHTGSNLATRPIVDGPVEYADLTGSDVDNPIYLGIKDTASASVEFHVWSTDMKQWVVHSGSNLPLTATGTTPSLLNSSVAFADLAGSGVQHPLAIQYKNTASGFVELWLWGSGGVNSWQQHIVTNLPAPLDPSKMQIGFADLDGSGKEEGIAFGIDGTSSGKVEFHVWAPGEQTWQRHIVSNLLTTQLAGCGIQFGDFSGSGKDNGVAICTQNTQSGRYELHVWNPDLTTWQGHYVSNQVIL